MYQVSLVVSTNRTTFSICMLAHTHTHTRRIEVTWTGSGGEVAMQMNRGGDVDKQ